MAGVARRRSPLKHGFYARPEALGFGEEARTAWGIDDRIALLVARRDGLDRWLAVKMAAGEDVNALVYLELVMGATWRIIRAIRSREVHGAGSQWIARLFDELVDESSDQPGPEA